MDIKVKTEYKATLEFEAVCEKYNGYVTFHTENTDENDPETLDRIVIEEIIGKYTQDGKKYKITIQIEEMSE